MENGSVESACMQVVCRAYFGVVSQTTAAKSMHSILIQTQLKFFIKISKWRAAKDCIWRYEYRLEIGIFRVEISRLARLCSFRAQSKTH